MAKEKVILEEENITRMVDVASAIILKDKKVLLIKRSSAHRLEPNKWQFPEGKLDEGESPEDALIREAREEIGRKVLSKKFLKKFPHQVPYEGNIYNVNRIVYRANIDEGVIALSDEHTEFAWFSLEDIKLNKELYVGIKEILEEITLQ